MALDAKVSFLSQMEKKLAGISTAEAMAKTMTALTDVLDGFELKEITVTEEQDDMMACFMEALRVEGRSEKTIAHYRGVLSRMMETVGVPARRINVYHLRSYISGLKESGLKDSTLEGYRQVMSSFFGWLKREDLIEKNPVVNLGSIKCPKVQKQIFSETDMERLRQGCTQLRDRAVVAFLAATGCRVSELIELNRDAVDLTGLECVVHGKGDKERVVFLDTVTAMIVRNYLARRTDENEALFVNRYGERFRTGGIREMLKRLEERTQVEHVHPHKFRRTLATNLAKRGMPIQDIAAILGHDKIETTMEYVMLNKDNVKIKYNQYYAS